MEFRVFCRGHLLHLHESVEHADDEDGGAHIEGCDDARRHLSLGSLVGKPYPGEEDGEEVSEQAAGVAEEALDGVGLCLLLLVHHIAHHHLEGLHRYVDAGIQEDKAEKTEPHGGVEPEEDVCGAEIQAAGIGQENHHQHGHYGTHQKVGLAASHAAPGAVGPFADERLDQHSHEGRKYPEETELVRIGAERREYAADIGTLEGISYLHSEESEAQIPHLPKG